MAGGARAAAHDEPGRGGGGAVNSVGGGGGHAFQTGGGSDIAIRTGTRSISVARERDVYSIISQGE